MTTKSTSKADQLRHLREQQAIAAARMAGPKASRIVPSKPMGKPLQTDSDAPAPAGDESSKEKAMKTKTKATGRAPRKAKGAAGKKGAASAPAAKKAAPTPKSGRTRYPWKEAEEGAAAGKMPPSLNFEAACNAPYRATLAEIETAAKAGDVKALKAFAIPDYNSIVKAMARWRDLAVIAVQAKAKAAA